MPEIAERVNKDIVAAMKAREEDKLTALRMVKSALKAKEIDKREPLTAAEEQSVLTTLLKQRRESVEQFTKGNRPELAAVIVHLMSRNLASPMGTKSSRLPQWRGRESAIEWRR